jgi:hypothetical protein
MKKCWVRLQMRDCGLVAGNRRLRDRRGVDGGTGGETATSGAGTERAEAAGCLGLEQDRQAGGRDEQGAGGASRLAAREVRSAAIERLCRARSISAR